MLRLEQLYPTLFMDNGFPIIIGHWKKGGVTVHLLEWKDDQRRAVALTAHNSTIVLSFPEMVRSMRLMKTATDKAVERDEQIAQEELTRA